LAEEKIKKLQARNFFDLQLQDPIGRYAGYAQNEKGEWVKEATVDGKLRLMLLYKAPFKTREDSIMVFGNEDREAHLENWVYEFDMATPLGN